MLDEQTNHSICRLPALGCIRLSGPDSAKFLQGQITINALQLAQHQLNPGALCNPQGRCVALFWATLHGEDILLLQLRETIDATIAHLNKYAVFFKTKIIDSSQDFKFFASLDSPEKQQQYSTMQNEANIDLLNIAAPDMTIFMLKSDQIESFEQKYAPFKSDSLWFNELAKNRIPWLSRESMNEFLPHNLDLPKLGAVDFKKGCFTGQEVIARMQYKGKLKSHMQLFCISATSSNKLSNIVSKTKVYAGEHVAGEVICAAQAEGTAPLILAVIKDNQLSGKNFRLQDPNGPILDLIPLAN